MKQKPAIRTIKLQPKQQEKYNEQGHRIVRTLPWLTTSGVWLADAGFRPGDLIDITVSRNKLSIRKKADSVTGKRKRPAPLETRRVGSFHMGVA